MEPRVCTVVLTGGPCAGKTTVQAVLSEFFEKRGWKVYRVPETASILLGGGVLFSELSFEQANQFQENLLRTMLQIETTYVELARNGTRNTIVICDRGAMDPSAYSDPKLWQEMLQKNNWTTVELRDARYDCVVHLTTAANGAEAFYTTENNAVRSEGIEQARALDQRTQNAWLGHPYFDVIDNSTGFKEKLQRVVRAVCKRLHIDAEEGPTARTKKRKFLVAEYPEAFPIDYQDFDVEHDYLVTSDGTQARIRRRGQAGTYMYTHTVRMPEKDGQSVELHRTVSGRQYQALRAQRDPKCATIRKVRRCFLYATYHFQLDIFVEPSNSRCKGLALLETYVPAGAESVPLPPFLSVSREVTGDPAFSMYTLAGAP